MKKYIYEYDCDKCVNCLIKQYFVFPNGLEEKCSNAKFVDRIKLKEDITYHQCKNYKEE